MARLKLLLFGLIFMISGRGIIAHSVQKSDIATYDKLSVPSRYQIFREELSDAGLSEQQIDKILLFEQKYDSYNGTGLPVESESLIIGKVNPELANDMMVMAVVHFRDPNLERAVRYALGKPSGDITDVDMATLTFLSASSSNISDLTGLEYAIHMQWLYLQFNRISDITPLNTMTEIIALRLDNNKISDITALQNMLVLRSLYLDYNQIKNITPLQNLTSLEHLWLSYNQIDDLLPLQNLTGLTVLILTGNQLGNDDLPALYNCDKVTWLDLRANPAITSGTAMQTLGDNLDAITCEAIKWDGVCGIDPTIVVHFNDANLEQVVREALGQPAGAIMNSDMATLTMLRAFDKNIADLTGLEYAIKMQVLYLDDNQVRDVTPLQNMTVLTNLDLENNQIVDITPLSNLTSLSSLKLAHNQITRVPDFSNLTNLWKLELNDNQITDISGLQNLSGLVWLLLQRNRITDITALANIASLSILYLSQNQIMALTALQNLGNLAVLHINDNQISDMTPLENLTRLLELYIGANQITDLAPLTSLVNLSRLWLHDNKISDITPLQYLTGLHYLHLERNQIRDISPLQNLTGLIKLWLADNQISDLDALENMTNLWTLVLNGNELDNDDLPSLYNCDNLVATRNILGLDLRNNPGITSGTAMQLLADNLDRLTCENILWDGICGVDRFIRVTETNPKPNQLNVDRTAKISITFDNPLVPYMVTANRFIVTGNQTGTHPGTFFFSHDLHTVVFNPDAIFVPGEEVTVTLTTGMGLKKSFVCLFTIKVPAGVNAFNETSESPLSSGVNPNQVVAADLNNDGNMDLVTGHSDEKIVVFLGNGAGTFQKQPSIPAGAGAGSIAVADFNRDGNLDLATCPDREEPDLASITVLTGTGDGTFQKTASYAVGRGANSIKAADFDGDGLVDLTVVNRLDGTVSVLPGTGNGTFANQKRFSVNGQPGSLAIGDFNNDGKLDLVTVDSETESSIPGRISLLCGTGNGFFREHLTLTIRDKPLSIGTGDLNADGNLDLVTTTVDEEISYSLNLLMGTGTGTFLLPQEISLPARPAGLVVADFNGDGHQDLATTCFDNDLCQVLFNQGAGNFAPVKSFPVGHQPSFIATGDFDNENGLDLAVVNWDSGAITILLNNYPPDNSLVFVTGTATAEGEGWDNAVDGDLDGWDGTTTACGSVDPNGPAWGIFRFADYQLYQFNYIVIQTDNGPDDDAWTYRQATAIEILVSVTGTAPADFTSITTIKPYSGDLEWHHLGEYVTAKYVKMVLQQPCDHTDGWRQLVEFELQTGNKRGAEPAFESALVARIPAEFNLTQNYPNPFNPGTTIAYQLPEECQVILKIFNLMGQEIRTLVHQNQNAGYYQVTWDGTDQLGSKAATGMYFYTIDAGAYRLTRKMVMMQ